MVGRLFANLFVSTNPSCLLSGHISLLGDFYQPRRLEPFVLWSEPIIFGYVSCNTTLGRKSVSKSFVMSDLQNTKCQLSSFVVGSYLMVFCSGRRAEEEGSVRWAPDPGWLASSRRGWPRYQVIKFQWFQILHLFAEGPKLARYDFDSVFVQT